MAGLMADLMAVTILTIAKEDLAESAEAGAAEFRTLPLGAVAGVAEPAAGAAEPAMVSWLAAAVAGVAAGSAPGAEVVGAKAGPVERIMPAATGQAPGIGETTDGTVTITQVAAAAVASAVAAARAQQPATMVAEAGEGLALAARFLTKAEM